MMYLGQEQRPAEPSYQHCSHSQDEAEHLVGHLYIHEQLLIAAHLDGQLHAVSS